MDEIDPIQEIKERYELPKTYTQAKQQAKKEIDEDLTEQPGSTAAKYESATLALQLTLLFVQKYRDRYYEYTEELKHTSIAFIDSSNLVYHGCRLFWCIQRIGEIPDTSESSVVNCFHTAGSSALSAAVKFCVNIWSLWASVLGRDLDYSVIKENFLERDFHEPEVIEYILKWRDQVHFNLCDLLPSEDWPEWKLLRETEQMLCLCEKELEQITESITNITDIESSQDVLYTNQKKATLDESHISTKSKPENGVQSEADRKRGILTTTQPKDTTIRDQVFICYSHKDKRCLDEMQIHLVPYLRNGSVKAWSDEQIEPSSKWFQEIKTALAAAKVAALLVTPNFLASDFIHEHEVTPLLKEAEKDNVCIIWIPVQACSYEQTPLKDYQAVIDPTRPLAKMRKADRDKAWVIICEEIKKKALCL